MTEVYECDIKYCFDGLRLGLKPIAGTNRHVWTEVGVSEDIAIAEEELSYAALKDIRSCRCVNA